MRVCIVSFSGRREGNCARIAREAQRCLAQEDVTLFDLAERPLHPCGGCHGECFADRKLCPHQDDEFIILDAITHSDLAFFIVPNYCDYPGSLYFAFNERSLCYFSKHNDLLEQYEHVRKRFIVVSGEDPTHFAEAFRQQTNGEAPDILMLSARAYDRSSIAGDLMEAREAREAVRQFVIKP